MGMLDDVKSKKKQKAAENWMKMAESAKTIEKQIEYYTKSLDIDPYNAQAWFNKGKCLEKLGRFEDAKKSFDLAVEIDPDYQGQVDTKYEPTVPSEPQMPDDSDHVGDTSASVVDATINDGKQPLTEDLQPASQKIQTSQKDDFKREGGYSFTPPSGDESAFSTMFIGGDDDNGTPSIHKEETSDAEDNVFGNDHKASSLDNEPETISSGSYVVGREEVNEQENKESGKENERDLPFSNSGYVEAEKQTLSERGITPEEQDMFKKEDVAVASAEEKDVTPASEEDVAVPKEAIDGPTDKKIGLNDTISKKTETGTVAKTYGDLEEKQDVRVGNENENENTFISSPAGVSRAAPYSAGYDENLVIGRKPDQGASGTIPVSGEHAGSAKQNKQAAGYDASSGTIATSRSVATSGAGAVDIRIPLSEAIKFWAIGIVAMLIVLIISSVL